MISITVPSIILPVLSILCFLFPSSDIMNNKIFYQHPNLMRVLGMHETVMEVVNVLGGGKSQVQFSTATDDTGDYDVSQHP